MKVNSPESLRAAETVFWNYGGSWTAAREAASRGRDGVLVIPRTPEGGGGNGAHGATGGRRRGE